MELVLQAAAFAAEKHRNRRRKDEEASPYINHPIQLAYILVQADVEDPDRAGRGAVARHHRGHQDHAR